MIRIGFTGTRETLTDFQRLAVREFLKESYSDKVNIEAHHGMCVGADLYFHTVVREVIPEAIIEGHPPTIQGRAFVHGLDCDKLWIPKDYLARDRDIVNSCATLIACPNSEERRGSGTWYTINHAKMKGKYIYLVYPDRIEEINV